MNTSVELQESSSLSSPLPSPSQHRSSVTDHIQARQYQGCITTVLAQQWYGPDYGTCSMHETILQCQAAVPTSPCPPARTARGPPTVIPPPTQSTSHPTTSAAPPPSHHRHHAVSPGGKIGIIIMAVVVGLFISYYFWRCVRRCQPGFDRRRPQSQQEESSGQQAPSESRTVPPQRNPPRRTYPSHEPNPPAPQEPSRHASPLPSHQPEEKPHGKNSLPIPPPPPPQRSNDTRKEPPPKPPTLNQTSPKVNKNPRKAKHTPLGSTSTAASHLSENRPPTDIELHDLEAGVNPWEGERSLTPGPQWHQPRWVNQRSLSASSDDVREGNEARERRRGVGRIRWVDELQKRECERVSMPGGYPSSSTHQPGLPHSDRVSQKVGREGEKGPRMSGTLYPASPSSQPQPHTPSHQPNIWIRQHEQASRRVSDPQRPPPTHQAHEQDRQHNKPNLRSSTPPPLTPQPRGRGQIDHRDQGRNESERRGRQRIRIPPASEDRNMPVVDRGLGCQGPVQGIPDHAQSNARQRAMYQPTVEDSSD